MDTCVFYTLSPNHKLYYFFCFSNCSSFGHWECFASCVPLTYPHPFAFRTLPYFLELQNSPGLFCIFPASAQACNFPASFHQMFLQLRVVIRNQDLDARCFLCYWGVIVSRPSQQTEVGNKYMFTNSCTHTYL